MSGLFSFRNFQHGTSYSHQFTLLALQSVLSECRARLEECQGLMLAAGEIASGGKAESGADKTY